jgi:hypothetical protein
MYKYRKVYISDDAVVVVGFTTTFVLFYFLKKKLTLIFVEMTIHSFYYKYRFTLNDRDKIFFTTVSATMWSNPTLCKNNWSKTIKVCFSKAHLIDNYG